MKVVVDTNVLMSGIFFGGVPGRVIDAWAAGRVEMVLSPEILDEYRRVGSDLAIRYPERAAVLIPVLTLVAVNATIVNAMPLKEQVSTDAADDMFLVSAFTVATSAPALTVSSFYDDAVTSQYTQCTGDESSYGSSGNWIASDIPNTDPRLPDAATLSRRRQMVFGAPDLSLERMGAVVSSLRAPLTVRATSVTHN